MDEQKKQLVEKLKSSSNILVTVRNSPSVDLLSACIGLTLMLNKLGKHASAVFSGEVPSTLEFLKPEETLEKDTNSLRDFIIALDKSKADKLRYKVEDKTVRIFITPFKTSLSQDDLEFSQGDFNVDVVVALGAHEQHELDQAITEHGRILHDATVASINNSDAGNLGSINWLDTRASSISEIVAQMVKDLGEDLLDEQVATALLTGIVAETERFSNSHTTPETMTVSSQLMAAGANQQLVATKLEESVTADIQAPANGQPATDGEPPKPDDGTLEIEHEGDRPAVETPLGNTPPAESPVADRPESHHEKTIEPLPDEPGPAMDLADLANADTGSLELPKQEPHEPPKVTQLHDHDALLPPVPEVPSSEVGDMTGLGFEAERPAGAPSPITANIQPEALEGALDPLGPVRNGSQPLMSHHNESQTTAPDTPPADTPPSAAPPEPDIRPNPVFEPVAPMPPADEPQPPAEEGKTLSEIEQDVHSTHLQSAASPADLASARDEVLKALQETPHQPEPIAALGAQPVDLNPPANTPLEAPIPPAAPADLTLDKEGNLQLPQLPTEPVNEPAPNPLSPADQPMDMPLPPTAGASGIQVPPPQSAPPTNSQGSNPNSPPPVPPPLMPPFPGQ